MPVLSMPAQVMYSTGAALPRANRLICLRRINQESVRTERKADDGRRDRANVLTFPDTYGGYALSRYPVLKIHHTAVRHKARKTIVMARLTPTLTSASP